MPDYTVPAMEAMLPEARLTFETNLFSVIRICQTFVPLLIKAKGTIVQIGSIAGVSVIGLSYSSSGYMKAYGFSFRLSPMLSDPSIMPRRLLCIHGVIPCGLNWPRLGEASTLLQQRVPSDSLGPGN